VAAARQAKLKHDGNDGAEPTAGDRSEDR
jgi:hypothetical protein